MRTVLPGGIIYILESSDDNETRIEEARTHEGGKLTDAIARGDIIMADTLEERTQKLGCDPAVLQPTVDEYNAMAGAGKDELTSPCFTLRVPHHGRCADRHPVPGAASRWLHHRGSAGGQ